MNPFPADSYLSLFTRSACLSNPSSPCAHSPPATLSTFIFPFPFPCAPSTHNPISLQSFWLHLTLTSPSTFSVTSTTPTPGSSPALCGAPSAPAGQPVSSRAKRLRSLPSPSFLPSASAAAASSSQPEPELRRGLLRRPRTSASSVPASAAGSGAGPASGPTPAASEFHRTASRSPGRPTHASGPQIHRQLRRLLLGLKAIQRTKLRDQPLPGLARLLGLVKQ